MGKIKIDMQSFINGSIRVRRFTIGLLAAALVMPSLAAFAQPIDPSTAPGFISSIGKIDTAAPNGAFDGPSDVAHDSSGNTYVVDRSNHRIQKFSSTGTFITKWGTYGIGNGQFNSPQGIAVDSSNNVYVSDTYNGRIQKFSSNGTYVTQWGESDLELGMDSLKVTVQSAEILFSLPIGIATDSSNNVYVADSGKDKILKFSSSGDLITEWGTEGEGNGEFYSPNGIAIDTSNNVFVLDSDNARIQKFTSNGTYASQWGSYGAGESQFDYPRGIATDSSGNVYVSDANINRVQKFSGTGTFISEWGEYGSVTPRFLSLSSVSTLDLNEGKFSGPSGIYIDVSGDIYVADTDNHRIQKFSSSTAYLTQWGEYGSENKSGSGQGEFDTPSDVASDSSGNLYVADTSNHRIQKFSSTGTFITKWGTEGASDGQFETLSGIAVDKNGNVYVTDRENHRVQKFTNSGTFITKWGTEGSGNGQFEYPIGITTDQSNNVYVADTDNHRIQKFSSIGTYLGQWGEYGEDGQIFDKSAGSAVSVNSLAEDGKFNYPCGIAADKNNNIYVTDTENNRVQKFTSNGTFITKWGEYGPKNELPAFNAGSVHAKDVTDAGGEFNSPTGITADLNGNVYVVDTNNDRVQKFTSNGTFLTAWGDDEPSQSNATKAFSTLAIPNYQATFSEAWGITSDQNGNVYVADTGNHRIQKFGYTNEVELAQPATGNNNKIVFQTPLDSTVTSSQVVTEQSIQKKDGDKSFPMGLVDFSLSVPSGSTQQIILTFVTELKPSDVTARKYHQQSGKFTDIPGSTVTETIIDSRHALQLTYGITDGGTLDDDGIVNGTIVDPVGLAVASNTVAPRAPDTGAGAALSPLIVVILTLLAVSLPLAYRLRHRL